MDHFRRQFLGRRIHPAVVLGIARKYRIPELIEQAVRVLARPGLPLSSWSTDPKIICHTTVIEVGTIGRLKEKILLARFALCAIPPVTHNPACRDGQRARCSSSWKEFWMVNVVPFLTSVGGEEDMSAWAIRTDCVAAARVHSMTETCMQWAINEAVAHPGWGAEYKMIDGAIEALMVSGH